MKDWDNDIKRNVREVIIGSVAGKQYNKVGDLPGNKLLSTILMHDHNVVSDCGTSMLFERDPDEMHDIGIGINAVGLKNCELHLCDDVAEYPTKYFNGMGFFNYDTMSHLTPKSIHLIDRIGWCDGATLALTIYHSNTRGKSNFLEKAQANFSSKWNPLKVETSLAELSAANRYHHLTYKKGKVVHETIDTVGSATIANNIEYSSMLFMLLKYALRNHSYTFRCAILYSGSECSPATRMLTFIIEDITKHTQPHRNIMTMDCNGSYSTIIRNIGDYFS